MQDVNETTADAAVTAADTAESLQAPAIQPQAPLDQQPMAYDYMAIDIETASARPDEVMAEFRRNWEPSKRLKPDTIGKKYFEALEKREAKASLIDESPIIAITIRSDSELRCLHCMEHQPPNLVGTAVVEGFATQGEMLAALAGLALNRVAPDTTIVGHNIKHFDLPKLRWMYVKQGVQLPGFLVDPGQPLYDTMREYGYRFSLSDKPFYSLDELLAVFGIESHKDLVHGSMISELYAQKKFALIIQYGLLDVIKECELFLRMVGKSGSRQ